MPGTVQAILEKLSEGLTLLTEGGPIMNLVHELEKLRVSHYQNDEDCWYSCPKSPDGCCNDNAGGECTRGADKHNAKLDEVLAYLKTKTIY